jgi:hypothetical protein
MSSFSLLTVFTRPISSRRATGVHLYNQWEPVRKIGSLLMLLYGAVMIVTLSEKTRDL